MVKFESQQLKSEAVSSTVRETNFHLQNECQSDLSENNQLIVKHEDPEFCECFEAIKISCTCSSMYQI